MQSLNSAAISFGHLDNFLKDEEETDDNRDVIFNKDFDNTMGG